VQKANGDTYSAYFHKLRKHYTLVNVDGPEERFEFDGYGTAVTPTDKGYGAAESYSKKYALRSLFLIETDDDPDAGGENVNIATPQARASTGAPARVPRPAAAAEQPAIQTTAHPAAVEIPDEAWREVANLWHDRGTISDKQLGRLFAIARSEGGWQSGDLVEEVVKHHLGIESMHAIPWGKPYDALVEIFRGFPPAQDPDTSAAEALEPPPDFDDGDGYA
jgi:hypothetical protein